MDKRNKKSRQHTVQRPGRVVRAPASPPLKYLDVSFNPGVTTTSYQVSLASIAAGTAFNQRVGNRIMIQNIELQYLALASVQSTIATADIYNNLRIAVLRLRVPSGNLVSNPLSIPTVFLPWDLKAQYEVVSQKMVFVNQYSSGLAAAGSAYGSSPAGKWMTYTIPFNSEVVYVDTTSGGDQINAPWLVITSDSSVTPNPSVTGYARIWFRDLDD